MNPRAVFEIAPIRSGAMSHNHSLLNAHATSETLEVLRRGCVNSALVRFADVVEAADTVNALWRARS